MTAYNREKFIAEAIESVINSTYENWELIVVDDQSKDKTLEIAKSYEQRDKRIKVFVNEKNIGDYPNRNKAASYAKGKYIKYLDSDDVIYPHGLQVMVWAMEKYPEAGFGLAARNLSNIPFPLLTEPKETYLEHFGQFRHFDRAPGSAIIKLEAFNSVGGFSGERMIGDYDLWFKIGAKYSMVKFQRDLVWDRMHAGQESSSDYAKLYTQLRKKVFERALQHENCPLNEEDIKQVLKNNRKRNFKNKIKLLFYV